MAELWAVLWRVSLLVTLPVLFGMIAGAVANRVKLRLDRSIPDNLPHIAGDWLRTQLAAHGLDHVPVVVTSKKATTTDAYHIGPRVIQLADQTYFKRDPLFWGIAAHELGHARFRHHHRIAAALVTAAGVVGAVARRVGVGLLIGHLLFDVPGSADPGLIALAVSLGCGVMMLVDEMAASWVAHGLAHESGMPPRYLRSVRLYLVAAFATYLASYVGEALVLALWPVVIDGHAAGVYRGAGGLGPVFMAVVCAAALVHAATRLVLMVAPATQPARRHKALWSLATLTWPVLLLAAAATVSARGSDPWTSLAMVSGTTAAAAVPALIVMLLAWRFRRATAVLAVSSPIDVTGAYLSARREGRALMRSGNRVIDELVRASNESPPWWVRANQVVELAHLPALIAWWLAG